MTAAKSHRDSDIFRMPALSASPALWESFLPSNVVVERFSRANAQAGQRWVEGMARWSKALGDFAVERVHQDMETLRKLGSCRTPEEMLEAHMNFAQTAAQQYMEETSKLLDLATRTCVDCMKPLDEAAKTTNEEMSTERAFDAA